MKYFKSENGEVYAYEADGSQDEYIKPGLVSMTEAEVQAHLNPPIPSLTREQIEALRLRAYADPLTGSDRYFVEASRLQEIGAAQEEIDVAKAAGANRYAEIQNAYPWPA
ncbi:hypothetical protein ACTXY8_22690 [Pseudomonas aeruginosa]